MGEDTVVLLTGGQQRQCPQCPTVRLSSTEVFPSTNGCSPPALPEPRSFHALFTTPEPNSIIAACGGWYGSYYGASCLVLDVENKRWDENIMGPLTMTRGYSAVVTLKNIGNYLIGGVCGGCGSNIKGTTDFLAQGSQQWVAGPTMPVDMNHPCTVVINERNFLAIYGNDIREYEVNIANPTSDNGWQQGTKWPQLQTHRIYWHGCIKIGKKVIVSGGYSNYGNALSSTEVLDLETRKIEYAGDLATPREFFQMVKIITVGLERFLAMGGYDGSALDSVEEFDVDTLTWKPASPAKLLEARYFYAAIALQRSLVC